FTSSALPASATIAGDYYRALITPNDGFANGATLTTTSLLVPEDFDANGLNDDWEVQYFGQIGVDPDADGDGDGLSNLQEFLSGTDPTDAASAFRISAVDIEGDDIRVTWTMGAGKTNLLQLAAGATGGSYSNDFTDLFGATNTVGTVTNYLDIGGATNVPSRFYRVRLAP